MIAQAQYRSGDKLMITEYSYNPDVEGSKETSRDYAIKEIEEIITEWYVERGLNPENAIKRMRGMVCMFYIEDWRSIKK